jgi:hypothetical protein
LLHATAIGPSKATDQMVLDGSLVPENANERLLTNLLPDSSVHSFASESMKLHSRRRPKNGSSSNYAFTVSSGEARSKEARYSVPQLRRKDSPLRIIDRTPC